MRVEEHLGYQREKPVGEIKTHLKKCDLCKQSNLDNFQIVQKSMSDHDAKINEALIIKNENPPSNKNMFNNTIF